MLQVDPSRFGVQEMEPSPALKVPDWHLDVDGFRASIGDHPEQRIEEGTVIPIDHED